MTSHAFDATLNVQITHVHGSIAPSDEHVLAWMGADVWPDDRPNAFMLLACTRHSKPGDCDDDCRDHKGLYRVAVRAADLDD